jgi:hypothetical protein
MLNDFRAVPHLEFVSMIIGKYDVIGDILGHGGVLRPRFREWAITMTAVYFVIQTAE